MQKLQSFDILDKCCKAHFNTPIKLSMYFIKLNTSFSPKSDQQKQLSSNLGTYMKWPDF